jgi:hypothetical protein
MTLFIVGLCALRLLCLAFAILLVVKLASSWRGHRPDPGLASLERRFALGELSEADFSAMRKVLEEKS